MYNSINSYTQDKKNCFSDGNIVMQLVIQGVKDIKIGKTFRKLKEKKILLDLSMVIGNKEDLGSCVFTKT